MSTNIIIFILANCFICIFCQCPGQKPSENAVQDAYASMINGIGDFSFSLLKQLNSLDSKSPGIFFSAFSVWSALSLVYIGAGGNTEKQLANMLGVPGETKASVLVAYHNLQQFWQEKLKSSNSVYRLANRIDFSSELLIDKCFLDTLPSEIKEVDFSQNPERARNNINSWVSKVTENKIKELIPAGFIDAMTRLVVSNAVYFKGTWMSQFEAKSTKKMRFTTSSLAIIYVDMMYQRGNFYYGTSDNGQLSLLELPYSGKDFSMIIILPMHYVKGLQRLVEQLNAEVLEDLLSAMNSREVQVSLPKFKVESSFQLSGALKNMGLQDLFDSQKSNLTGFGGRTNNLAADAIFHKSFVDVSEEGTEAAAATSVLSSRTARVDGPASFNADRPFLYLIKDNLLNVILFMGTVQKPQYTV